MVVVSTSVETLLDLITALVNKASYCMRTIMIAKKVDVRYKEYYTYTSEFIYLTKMLLWF